MYPNSNNNEPSVVASAKKCVYLMSIVKNDRFTDTWAIQVDQLRQKKIKVVVFFHDTNVQQTLPWWRDNKPMKLPDETWLGIESVSKHSQHSVSDNSDPVLVEHIKVLQFSGSPKNTIGTNFHEFVVLHTHNHEYPTMDLIELEQCAQNYKKILGSSGLLVQSHTEPGLMVVFITLIKLLETNQISSELRSEAILSQLNDLSKKLPQFKLHHHQLKELILACWSLKAQITRICKKKQLSSNPIPPKPESPPPSYKASPSAPSPPPPYEISPPKTNVKRKVAVFLKGVRFEPDARLLEPLTPAFNMFKDGPF